MKYVVSFNLILLSLLLPFTAMGKTGSLNILYTGSIQGELEPCGCSPKTDFGGLARLSGYLKKNSRSLSPYLLLDAGNFSGEDNPQGRIKTETMIRIFGLMKYDSVAMLEREKAFTDNLVSSLSSQYRISTVSSSEHYIKSIEKTAGRVKVHISASPEDRRQGVLNILLTGMPVSGLKDTEGWDVIITSSGEVLDEPVLKDGTIIASGYPKGEKFGILTLLVDDKGNVAGHKHRWQQLGAEITEDTGVRKILKEYDAQVADLIKKAERPLADSHYLGADRCAECHQPFVENWRKTRHATAFADLERTGKSFDPECVKCHSVGYGEEGGFYSMGTTPHLANVQCEVCHGPGKEHLLDLDKPMRAVTEAVCLTCHTKDNSPDFDYQNYRKKIIHTM